MLMPLIKSFRADTLCFPTLLAYHPKNGHYKHLQNENWDMEFSEVDCLAA